LARPDGIGPAAFANRQKVPDLDMEGHARIVPLSSIDTLWIDGQDADPRGMAARRRRDRRAVERRKVARVRSAWKAG
jgi:hypothetical protein